MKVSELGEFGLIDLLAKMIPAPQNKKLILGIGDDAAAWDIETTLQLVTTDSFFQDVHFSLSTTPWEVLGAKALAVNLSDIAAMGGVPEYAVVSLALPGNTEVAGVTALYHGLIGLAGQFGVAIIGGDTCRAPLVSITMTVLGRTVNQEKKILTRSAARPGDMVAVTGHLGAAAAGMEMLTRRLRFDLGAATQLRDAFLRPVPRLAEGQWLVGQEVKAAIDISDGLIADLSHICRASRVGARVEVEHLPIHPAVKVSFGDRSLELAMGGGEDYELLFTAGARTMAEVKEAATCPVTVIGEMVADKENKITVMDASGRPVPTDKTGWEHFKAA
ncbi:MAG: thiamine-phosphate kinase [Dehalococcoidales bacterium]|jgi:thiamine-monophosphate kinase|nr:thiamine-phosphate kinase [Dehalococcoidales bacterium]MDP7286078.1 thiamine-phosphate kinase [Dehalococcoidales bacterium]MDP7416116.1 thiamine-phosphate kinase [Dehalococcoidales bacterium]